MKAKTAKEALRLDQIPNIGKAMVQDFQILGITRPTDLKGKDGIELYRKLNKLTKQSHDPCVADTFMAAVDFMNGGSPKPWWAFTEKRKKIFLEKK